jgi:IS5 family transposase
VRSRHIRRQIAERLLDGLEVTSAEDALRRYGDPIDGGPGPHTEESIDEVSGLRHRTVVSAAHMGDGVVLLNVAVWPLPKTRVVGGRRRRPLAGFIDAWANAPVVRFKRVAG